MENGHNNSSVTYFATKISQEDYSGLYSSDVLVLEDNHKGDQCNIHREFEDQLLRRKS